MGAGFVIIFWAILAGIYAAVFLVFAGLWFWGRKKKIKWLKWLAGIPALGMLVFAMVAIAFIVYSIIDSRNPNSVFKSQFGIVPPVSVSGIQSSDYWFADTGSVYLRFKTTPETFEKLVPSRLQKMTFKESPSEVGGIPAWWDYQIAEDWILYLHNGSNERGFASETEFFAYNPKTRIAYYHFIGID